MDVLQIGTVVRPVRSLRGTIEKDVVYGDPKDGSNRVAHTISRLTEATIAETSDPGPYEATETSQSVLHELTYAVTCELDATYQLVQWPAVPAIAPIPHSFLTLTPPPKNENGSWKPSPITTAFEPGEFAYTTRVFNPNNAVYVPARAIVHISSGVSTKTGQPRPDRTSRLDTAYYFFSLVDVTYPKKTFKSDQFMPPDTYR